MSSTFPTVRHSTSERLALLGLRVATVCGLSVLLTASLTLLLAGARGLWLRAEEGDLAGLLLPAANASVAALAVVVVMLPLVLPALLELRLQGPQARRTGRRVLDAVVAMPPLVSGVCMVLVLETAQPWLGGELVGLVGGAFGLGLFGGARLASGLHRSLDRVPSAQLLAARALGASPLQAWFRIGLPQMRRPLVAHLLRTSAAVFADAVILLSLWLWLGTPESGTTTLGVEVALQAVANNPALTDLGLCLFIVVFSATLLADRIDPPSGV